MELEVLKNIRFWLFMIWLQCMVWNTMGQLGMNDNIERIIVAIEARE